MVEPETCVRSGQNTLNRTFYTPSMDHLWLIPFPEAA